MTDKLIVEVGEGGKTYSCSQTNQDIGSSKQRAYHAVLRLMCTGS